MTKDPLDDSQRHTVAIHDGRTGMPDRMEPEVPERSFCTEPFHQLFPITMQVDALSQLLIEEDLISEQKFYEKLKQVQAQYRKRGQ